MESSGNQVMALLFRWKCDFEWRTNISLSRLNQSCEQIVPLLCIPSFRAEGWLCMLAGFIWSAASLLLSRQDSSTILYSQPEDSLWKLNSYVLRFLRGYQGNRVKNCVSWKRNRALWEKNCMPVKSKAGLYLWWLWAESLFNKFHVYL